MKQASSSAQDSTLVVTITVGQLRDLVRSEMQAIVASSVKSPRPAGDKEYFSVKEAAECSGLGASTIRLQIRRKQLAVQHVGRRVLIKRSDLDSFLQSHPMTARSNQCSLDIYSHKDYSHNEHERSRVQTSTCIDRTFAKSISARARPLRENNFKIRE